uniref:Uncharacterized protein LOC111112636 n=1 Tax=Crassostrea virginica TaxID=6565 RepID=A0A8B8BRT2_CRAVI|nr:uncharacterized protein LOC111112636 [Crassostrea virginica]
MLIYVRYHNRQSTTLFHLQCWRYRFCRLTGKRHIGLCMHARLPRELKRFDATIRNFSVIPVTETEKGERPRNFVNVRKFSLSTLCDGRKSENVKTVMSSTKKQMWVLVLYESEEVLSHPLPLGEVQDLSGRNGEEADLQEGEQCMARYYVGDKMCKAKIYKRSESKTELEKIYEELLKTGKKEQKEKEEKSSWQRGAKVLGVGLLVGGAAVVGAPLALSAVGFSSTGIVAGSMAAKMMSMAAVANGGGVAAGGLIAAAQSAGAAGIATSTSAFIGTAAGSVGAFAANKMFKKESQDSSNGNPSSTSDGPDPDNDAPLPRTSDSSDPDLEDAGSPQILPLSLSLSPQKRQEVLQAVTLSTQ